MGAGGWGAECAHNNNNNNSYFILVLSRRMSAIIYSLSISWIPPQIVLPKVPHKMMRIPSDNRKIEIRKVKLRQAKLSGELTRKWQVRSRSICLFGQKVGGKYVIYIMLIRIQFQIH